MVEGGDRTAEIELMDTNPTFYSGDSSSGLQKPEIIGYYSVDSGSGYSSSLSGLKYVSVPKYETVNFDLNQGLENEMRNDMREHFPKIMECIAKWLTEQESGDWMEADFITDRGLLTTLMCAPYEKNIEWIVYATKVKKTIFLFSELTEQEKEDLENMTEHRRLCASWDYKFKQYLRAGRPDSQPNTEEPMSESDEFVGMFKARLNEHSLIYAAGIDGIQSEELVTNLEGAKIIGLRTNINWATKHMYSLFRRKKTLRWWAQSFLGGVQKIICGLRDGEGIVNKLRFFEVAKLPHMGKKAWDPCVCLNFCEKLLTDVKNLLQEEDSPHVVWKCERKPRQNVTFERFENPTDFRSLPDWFLEHVTSANVDA